MIDQSQNVALLSFPLYAMQLRTTLLNSVGLLAGGGNRGRGGAGSRPTGAPAPGASGLDDFRAVPDSRQCRDVLCSPQDPLHPLQPTWEVFSDCRCACLAHIFPVLFCRRQPA